jgi:heme oxygenase
MRERLREATSDLHAAIDARFAPLVDGGIDGYRRFLDASAAVVVPLERVLSAADVQRLLPDWGERVRTPALLADLTALGISPREERPCVPVPPSEAFQFGALYVLEGSRLGAGFLARVVEQAVDPRVRAATRYLRHGRGRRFWESYLDRLEASDAVRNAPAEVIGGARAAFARFGAVLPDHARADEMAQVRHAD